MDYSVIIVKAVGAVGILALLMETVRYKRELRAVSFAKQIAKDTVGGLDALFEAILFSPNKAVPLNSLVFRRLTSLAEFRKAHCVPPWDELSSLDRQETELSLAHRVAKVAMSCLLILGICLTFAGLTSALRHSRVGVLQGEDQARNIEQMVNVMVVGFQTSFDTSTTAIGGMIACLCLQLAIVSPLRERFFHSLDSLVQLRLAPLMAGERVNSPQEILFSAVTAKMDAVCVELRSSAEILGDTLRSVQEAGTSLASFGTQFSGAIESFESAIGGNSQFVSSVVDLQRLLSQGDARHEEMIDRSREAIGEVRRQNATLAAQQVKLLEFMTLVQRNDTNLKQALTELTKQAGEATARFEVKMKGSVTELITTAVDVTTRFHTETSQRVEKVCSELDTSVLKLNTTLSEVEGGFDRVVENLEHLHAGVGDFEREVKKLGGETNEKVTELNRELKGLIAAVDIGLRQTSGTPDVLRAGLAPLALLLPLMQSLQEVVEAFSGELEATARSRHSVRLLEEVVAQPTTSMFTQPPVAEPVLPGKERVHATGLMPMAPLEGATAN